MVLTEVGLYLSANNGGYVRAAVYVGGTGTDPSGATLVADLGLVTVPGAPSFATKAAAGNPALPSGARLWVAVKFPPDAPADVYYNDASAPGDWVGGRYASTSITDAVGTAFPATWPADSGSFNSSVVFGWYITYETSGNPPQAGGAILYLEADVQQELKQAGIAATVPVPLRSPTGAILAANPLAAGDVRRSLNGGASAGLSADANAGTWAVVNGFVQIPLSAAEVGAAGDEVTLLIKDQDGAAFVDHVVKISVVGYNPADAGNTLEQITAGVRTELATELARVDVPVSSRSTLTGAQAAAATRTELATELARVDATVSSRSTLTATGVRTELATELARLDTSVGSRAAPGAAMALSSAERTAVADALLNRELLPGVSFRAIAVGEVNINRTPLTSTTGTWTVTRNGQTIASGTYTEENGSKKFLNWSANGA